MESVEDCEFKTIDGLTLRGRMYPADKKGPGVILCPGFNCMKDMMGLPDAARIFQKSGISALIYDPRSTGSSDGIPRSDIDPSKQTEDYSDALTFMSTHPAVDPSQMVLWGMSFSGAAALSAASLDKRVKAVIAVCPAVEYQYSMDKLPKVLAKCIKDRESQIKGNEPFYLPVLTETGENPAGFNFGIDKDHGARIVNAGRDLGLDNANRTTIQTYYKLVMWRPSPLWQLLQCPAMFIIPELDQLATADVQMRYFNELPVQKRAHVEKGKGHMDILEGEHFEALMDRQVQFVRDALAGTVE